ncbi:CMT1A duplicated region transcript 1 protein [Megalops cyprinoides]|uniref:CMT1A duplicated region transcript 1 protein n=1 Tax=Megalops cyprinoides TaxID=118141 RepID=UPI00186564FC|nr:CMT1A duplicated region transcript 1 protein [Megalops cyprinoides]
MKHSEAKEICEYRLNAENHLWCKKGDSRFSTCGTCKSCLCLSKLSETTQWLSRAGGASKWRFLIGILVRCKSVDILESVYKILQVTLGKDFTYARSRQKPGVPEYLVTWSSDRALDGELIRKEMRETWDWFSDSKYWTKVNYILGLLSLCHTELLHALGNLIGVLIVREKRALMGHDAVLDDLQDGTPSIPESHYTFNSDDHPELELLIRASSNYQALDIPGDVQDPESAVVLQEIHNLEPSKRQREEFCLHKESAWAGLEEPGCGGVVTEEGVANTVTDRQISEDPALTVVPGSSKSLSGVSRHRDFIRRLPVHLAKRILGLVGKAGLLSCRYVSQHWRLLANEIEAEIATKRMVENQAMIMQGSSSVGVSSVFNEVREVLVPVKEDEKDVTSEITTDRGFETAYVGIRTKPVEMEEKNVFCGAYNILVLSSREDPARVVHFSGGQLVAVGSNDRLVRLLDVKTMKERPPVMQGHAGSIRAVHLCEDRGLVISAGYDLTIRCWNLTTGICTMLFRGHFGTINCLDLHGNKLVSGAKDCRVKVWNLLTGKCYQRLKFKHDSPVQCVKVARSLVLSSCDRGQLKMWDTGTGSLLKLVDTPQGAVRCLHLDEWHILSGGADGYVMAWSTSCEYAKCLMTYRHPREVLALTLLFLRVITGCVDGKIRIFDFLSGDCLRVIMSNSQQSPVHSLHICDNNIVLNTRTSVLLFQFGKDSGDYALPPGGDCVEKVNQESPKGSPSGVLPCFPERAQMGSSTHRDWKQAEKTSHLHHAYSLSTPSMQQEKSAEGSLRPATGGGLQGHRPCRAYIDLQPDINAMPQSARFPGRRISRPARRPRTSTFSSAHLGKRPVAKTSLLWSPSSAPSGTPSQRVLSSVSPQPLVRPTTGQPHPESVTKQPQVPYGMGKGKVVRKVGAFTTTAERDIRPDRRPLTKVSHKAPGRRVDFETPAGPGAAVPQDPFDPFRKRSLFRLLTPTQEEERERAAAQQHLQARARDQLAQQRQWRRAWLAKARGPSAAGRPGEGRVHAPELGHGTYI